MRNLVLIAMVVLLTIFAAAAESKASPGKTALANALEPAVSIDRASKAADRDTFDFPRVARKRGLKVTPNLPCGGCACWSECDVWSDSCRPAPASHCKPFGFESPCTCSSCVCF